MNYADDFLFLNTPISTEEDDIIGVGTHIKKLNAVIDSDAQMIAITSPFGAGKTSVIGLLQVSREGKRKDQTFCERMRPPRPAKEKLSKSLCSHASQKMGRRRAQLTCIAHLFISWQAKSGRKAALTSTDA